MPLHFLAHFATPAQFYRCNSACGFFGAFKEKFEIFGQKSLLLQVLITTSTYGIESVTRTFIQTSITTLSLPNIEIEAASKWVGKTK